MNHSVDDDDDDDVATVIGPARAFLPHLHTDEAPARPPTPGPSATVQINDGRNAPTLQLQAVDANALVATPAPVRPRPPPAAPTMLVGDRARQAAGTPTGFMIYLAVCGVLTAAGVALLVVLRTQGKFLRRAAPVRSPTARRRQGRHRLRGSARGSSSRSRPSHANSRDGGFGGGPSHVTSCRAERVDHAPEEEPRLRPRKTTGCRAVLRRPCSPSRCRTRSARGSRRCLPRRTAAGRRADIGARASRVWPRWSSR